MRVTDIISVKGSEVVTLLPTATVGELVRVLAGRGIGAVIVMEDNALVGIVSERDVVSFVDRHGDLSVPISGVMTTDVTTCGLEDEIQDLATVMTEQRIRHLPVLDGGQLVAIVSLGDVVKARLDDLEAEKAHLESYLHG